MSDSEYEDESEAPLEMVPMESNLQVRLLLQV